MLETFSEACVQTTIHPINASEMNGRLVSFTAFVLQETLENQCFIPIIQDRNGDFTNVGLFCNYNVAEIDEEMVVKKASFMSRRCFVVGSLPEESAWSGKILIYSYRKDIDVDDDDDDDDQNRIKVNDLVQITGIFETTTHPCFEAGFPYYLPSVHAFSFHKSLRVTLPLSLERSLARYTTLELIQEALNVNKYSALLFLGSLISRVVARTAGLYSSLLIGFLPLNVRTMRTAEEAHIAISFLSSLFPRFIIVRLNKTFLETQLFASHMNLDTGELMQGILQVPKDTLIIIDETELKVGPLSEMATRNLATLKDLILHQQINYDFAGHHIPIPMNVPVISISHQSKSVLPIHLSIDIAPRSNVLSSADMASIRSFLQNCGSLNAKIQVPVAKQIENFYVTRRQAEGKVIDAESLFASVNLARIVAVTYGSSSIEMHHFLEAHKTLSELRRPN